MKRKHQEMATDVERSVECSVNHDDARDANRPPFDFTVPPLDGINPADSAPGGLPLMSPARSPTQGAARASETSPAPWATRDFDALLLQLDADMAPPADPHAGARSGNDRASLSAPASPDPLGDHGALQRAAESLSLHATS